MTRWSIVAVLLSVACGEDFEPVVELPEPPENGFQLLFKQVTVQPGEDLEFCTYFNLENRETLEALGARAFDKNAELLDDPFLLQHLVASNVDLGAEEIAVEKIEIIASQGLHHVQLLALENDTFDYDERHIFECGIDLFGGPLTGDVEPLFFTSLDDYAAEYVPGTARILRRTIDVEDETRSRAPQLLYNFHYLNPGDQAIEAEVVVNFHTVDRATVEHPIRSAWWNFIYFNAEAGTSSMVDATGSFKVDVELVGVTSHQHELGAAFTYGRGGEEIYVNDNWSEPPYLTFPPDTILPTGEALDFHCAWDNPTAADRFFGLKADDEMCTAIIEYHPVDEVAAEALLEQLREEAEQGGGQGSPFGAQVSLETFYPLPEEIIEQIAADPDSAIDILDGEIMCGVAANMKEMEEQYGRAPDNLAELQRLVDLLGELCDL